MFTTPFKLPLLYHLSNFNSIVLVTKIKESSKCHSLKFRSIQQSRPITEGSLAFIIYPLYLLLPGNAFISFQALIASSLFLSLFLGSAK